MVLNTIFDQCQKLYLELYNGKNCKNGVTVYNNIRKLEIILVKCNCCHVIFVMTCVLNIFVPFVIKILSNYLLHLLPFGHLLLFPPLVHECLQLQYLAVNLSFAV